VKEYPVIKVKRGKIRRGNKIWKKGEAKEVIQGMAKDYEMVYVIDVDGYRKNSPNLELYKKVGNKIWVDSYPRYVEDVMDLIIVGIERITIWNMKEEYLREVREMSEEEIFIGNNDVKKAVKIVKNYGFNGVVLEENQECKEDIEIWKLYENEEIIRRIREWKS